MKIEQKKIVFYDGDCGFCNRSVQFILRTEKHHEIEFSTLQSERAKRFFTEKGMSNPDLTTFFYAEGEEVFQKSTAAFRVAKNLRLPFSLLRVFSIFPEWITDQVYNFIAKYRTKIAGTFCVLPTPEQKKRFVA